MGHYVVFVHGIGQQNPGSYEGFEDKVKEAYNKELQKRKKIPEQEPLVWEEDYWADVVEKDEIELAERLGVSKLIKTAFCSIGDIIAYSKLKNPPDNYTRIQDRFASTIKDLGKKAEEAHDVNASLDVIAHSLGTVIASDGLYDIKRDGEMPTNLTLNNLFTMGSPIALYGLRYGLANFNKTIKPKNWINIYYPNDFVAYPLKPLNDAYQQAVSEDMNLSAIGIHNWINGIIQLISRIPGFCHSWYFKDPRVINKIASVLAQN